MNAAHKRACLCYSGDAPFVFPQSALKLEDGDNEDSSSGARKDRRKSSLGVEEVRRSRRSMGNSAEVWARINNTTAPRAPPVESITPVQSAFKPMQRPSVCILPPSPPKQPPVEEPRPPSPPLSTGERSPECRSPVVSSPSEQ